MLPRHKPLALRLVQLLSQHEAGGDTNNATTRRRHDDTKHSEPNDTTNTTTFTKRALLRSCTISSRKVDMLREASDCTKAAIPPEMFCSDTAS